MLRLTTFLEEAADVELALPITPSSYQWAHEAAIEMVTVGQLGDLNFFGGKKMGSTTLHDCPLPVQAYPFLSPGAGIDLWLYLEQLERWVDRGTVVWWLVSGTPVNTAVLLEGVTYREQDGTNDLYTDITLCQYARSEIPVLLAESSASGVGTAASRDSVTGTAMTKTRTVANGDTLWGIYRRYYGDGSLAWWLVAANGIANANLIRPGQVLTTPPLAQLPVVTVRPPSAQIAAATKVREVREEKGGTVRPVSWVSEHMVKNLVDLELGKITSGGGLWQNIR